MDVSRLRTLRELAQCGTMAAAAEALFLTPSAVSQQIAQLEEETGHKLTERRGRGVRLTPAGAALVGHTERLMVILDEAKAELAVLKREIAGELRVAAFPSIASAVLPQTLKALRQVFPRLDIVLEELEPVDGLAALGSWRTDIAVIDDLSLVLEPRQKQAIELVPLAEDVLHVLLPAGHALAGRKSLTIADLRHQAWAMDSSSTAFAESITRLCRRAGYEPQLNAKCRGFEMVRAMVASGCSVSVVPGLRLVRPLEAVKAVRLRPEVRRHISLAYRQGERHHPAITVFVEEALRTAGRLLRDVRP